MVRKAKIGAAVVAAILAIIVVLQNTHSARTRFLFYDGNIPLVGLVIVALLMGFVIGIGTASALSRRRRRK